ncbi:MAG: purine-nucleoside phosphorylase [Chloroflexi bacterium]|nr:purine-nucleoside phosphorylase [Chloroflexota bacterium]MCL5275548.1 purine-nucleoside phosphorylase [Chloroflexota bacterium]
MKDADLQWTLERAADAVRALCARECPVLLVLGSGLGGLAEEMESPVRIPYGDVPGFAVSTVPGHSGGFLIGDLCGVPVIVMQGRVHFYEGYPMWQITLPVRVAHLLGAQTMIVSNAAGGINRDFRVGDVMLMTDHINLLGMAGHNPLIGPNLDTLGPRFPSMTAAYDPALRQAALRVAAAAGVDLKQGVYAGLAGPSFETPAELRFLRAIGADAVGMSTVNEVLVARHAGMRVLGFSGITNVARLSQDEGEPPSHQEVLEAGPKIAPRMLAIVKGVLGKWT